MYNIQHESPHIVQVQKCGRCRQGLRDRSTQFSNHTSHYASLDLQAFHEKSVIVSTHIFYTSIKNHVFGAIFKKISILQTTEQLTKTEQVQKINHIFVKIVLKLRTGRTY